LGGVTEHPTAGQSPVEPAPARATSTDDAIWRDWLAAVTRPGIGAVVALTLVGAALRLVNLDQPALLFDEAATYTRVTGSFRELLNILRYDGFAPLHYELYWLMGRFVRLTPEMMRLVPALAGTAMIPAVYFLARQIVSKRVATVAAALVTFSAFANVYSRDAKMYMHLWLFATLFVASLLWWLRERDPRRRRIAWLAWVASAAAMNGLHALGLLVIVVGAVIVLTHARRDARTVLLAAAGLLIACAGIAGHYALFNRFGQKLETQGWRSSGLDWVGQRNRALGRPMVLWDTAASWLVAYRAPKPPITPPTRVIVPVAIVSGVLLALLIAGAMPWPRRLRDDDPDDAPPSARGWRGPTWLIVWIALPCVAFGIVEVAKGRGVWTARYLGIVFPAVVVGMAWLIQRLPLPWLRAGAIALFVGANLVQVGLKMSVDTNAPVDAIAHDVAAAKKGEGELYTVVAVRNDADATSLGGNGGIYDFPGRYYLTIEQHLHLRPRELRGGAMPKALAFPTDVTAVPGSAERVIVWTDGGDVKPADDPILKALGAGWVRQSSREIAVRDFWNWRRTFRCRRSVYVRSDAAEITAPSPKPKKRK
jgi:4-amino-4-deoxy-L-arabinose transferase-like glycosyltransferase